MITIIDYGMGNLRSVEKVLQKIGKDYIISSKKEDIEKATHILFPGVGHFEEGMENLKNRGLIPVLKQEILENRKPFLGICLGMQLLFKRSEEGKGVEGLGFIDGEIKKFSFESTKQQKIPHIGWNEVQGKWMKDMQLFQNIEPKTNFYFVHSYHAVLNEDVKHTTTDYGYDFISSIEKENIFGTQFHPEKSQKKGLEVLKNFLNGEEHAQD
jgi:glutamine amidotransferase